MVIPVANPRLARALQYITTIATGGVLLTGPLLLRRWLPDPAVLKDLRLTWAMMNVDPASAFASIGLNWILLVGQRVDLTRIDFGLSLVIVGSLVSFFALLFVWGVRMLHRRDLERLGAVRAHGESEERMRLVLESALDAVVTIDAAGTITSFNPQAEKIFGWRIEEAVGRSLSDTLIPPRYRQAHTEGLKRFLATGEGPVLNRRIEIEALHKDGHEFPVELTITPLRSSGSVIFSAFVREITERKRAEQEQRRHLDEIADLYDNAPCGYHSLDKDGFFVRVNGMELGWLGYTREELIRKKKFTDALTSRSAAVFREHFARFKEEGSIRDLEIQMVRRDGSVFSVLLGATAILDAQGHFVSSRFTLFDITDRVTLENQLRQAQQMEVIGRLAGGVAHDFNNLLTPILGYTSLLLERLDPNDPLREEIEEIRKAGQRAAGLTQQILAFSRRQVLQPKVLDLNGLISDAAKLLRRLIGEDIHLVLTLAPELGRVKVDPPQMEQVIMNVVINARDAMPRGGRITIETANVTLDEEYAKSHAEVAPGPYVMIAISDTGTGMDRETLVHLFEPFFTTKERGKGTGLGLATVHGIVKQSGGHIWVYSEMGRGSTFKIYLPRVEEQLSLAPPSPVQRPSYQGSETILIVEDDDSLRKLASTILRSKGYTVFDADRGEDALIQAKSYMGPIHLLLVDVIMPGMSGREVAQHVKASRPLLKVLYMSGYTEAAIGHHGVLDEGMAFIEKPFTPEGLVRKVRHVLDEHQTKGF
ncbi:MAG: PAS domain S-box protein [Planctomycetes bacterium]|nr:PAS domain S-box protein [Planctomycetota bacterium]